MGFVTFLTKKMSEKFGSLVFKPSESILEPQFAAITATLVEVLNIFDHLKAGINFSLQHSSN